MTAERTPEGPSLSFEALRAGLGAEARTLAALEALLARLGEILGPVPLDAEGIWHRVSTARPRDRNTAESRAAFHEVYAEHVEAVHAFVRRRVGAADAEELTAETFTKAYEAFPRWEDRGVPIRAWLMRIAYHQVVGRSRKPAPLPVPDVDHTNPGRATYPGSEDHADAVDRRLDASGALEALSSLPTSHRTVLELRHLHELSVPETAVVLGLSEEATRALTYRAMQGLRKAYAKHAAVAS